MIFNISGEKKRSFSRTVGRTFQILRTKLNAP